MPRVSAAAEESRNSFASSSSVNRIEPRDRVRAGNGLCHFLFCRLLLFGVDVVVVVMVVVVAVVVVVIVTALVAVTVTGTACTPKHVGTRSNAPLPLQTSHRPQGVRWADQQAEKDPQTAFDPLSCPNLDAFLDAVTSERQRTGGIEWSAEGKYSIQSQNTNTCTHTASARAGERLARGLHTTNELTNY